MPTLTIALKDLRLLLRDPRSAVILLAMPLVLILILGLTIGEAFGRKPDQQIRVTVLVEDEGRPANAGDFPGKPWSEVVIADLGDVGNVRVERVADRAEAERLTDRGDRAAVVVFGKEFSDRAQRCSFVGADFKPNPLNPLNEYGVNLDELDVRVLPGRNQPVGASVIQQVVQVSLLRVIIPWMIGQAFELIGSDKFMERMEKHLPQLRLAYPFLSKETLGKGIKAGIKAFFSEYDFEAKTWPQLTKKQTPEQKAANQSKFAGGGLGLNRGTVRYQILVPSYTVTFAFFLVLTVGWLFVAERRHGTLVRLRAAPLSRGEILLGKLIPCFLISLVQGFLLLLCGKAVFGMSWGDQPWLLVPVVASTAFAAVGLAVLVAGFARTETQVAVYGTLIVLVLAGISGSMMPREMMPEEVRQLSLVTPHAWALDAYAQLLNPDNPSPHVGQVLTDCAALTGFGAVFLLLAWLTMRLERVGLRKGGAKRTPLGCPRGVRGTVCLEGYSTCRGKSSERGGKSLSGGRPRGKRPTARSSCGGRDWGSRTWGIGPTGRGRHSPGRRGSQPERQYPMQGPCQTRGRHRTDRPKRPPDKRFAHSRAGPRVPVPVPARTGLPTAL